MAWGVVAPFMGAWIEINPLSVYPSPRSVAPFMGAWIEIRKERTSRPTIGTSHPSWVRGLKSGRRRVPGRGPVSHPSWVRGLKSRPSRKTRATAMSHPSWVCGLKFDGRRTIVRCIPVAPFMGAWIEIRTPGDDAKGNHGSHPSWVRGLK